MNKEVNRLSIIVFSKDRPLQLHGYLDSLLYFSNINQSNISILYKETPSIDYSNLIKTFPEVKWIKEGSFYSDVIKIIQESNDYIMFGCDDVIFKENLDLNYAIDVLMSNNSIFGFSTRLGLNIKPLPKQIINGTKHFEWSWRNTSELNWNYPWELDATIYSKLDVLEIVSTMNPLKILNPNFFEGEVALHTEIIKKDRLASYHNGKCIVITVNRVQDDYKNDFDCTANTDIDTLNKLYKDGRRIDYILISKLKNKKIHVGSEFFILQDKNPIIVKIAINYLRKVFVYFKNKVKKIYKKIL